MSRLHKKKRVGCLKFTREGIQRAMESRLHKKLKGRLGCVKMHNERHHREPLSRLHRKKKGRLLKNA